MDDPTPTDVITFPLEPVVDGILDGEIVVSTETALREAPRHQTGAGDEVRLYIVHGLLHLLGHDDQDEPGEKSMNRLQQALLDRWKAISGPLGD
jgi:probable rRNA maturation factor